MAPFNKFNNFVNDLDNGLINLASDAFYVMLTNTAPSASNHHYADVSATELANGNGYLTGGQAVGGTAVSNSSGTDTFVGNQVVWTWTGAVGPFRYAILYDHTAASKNLVGWWDYGSSVSDNSPDTFTWQPNGQATGGTIYTLT